MVAAAPTMPLSPTFDPARLARGAIATASLLWSSFASAEPASEVPSDHDEHHRIVVGANAMALGAVSPDRFVSAIGVGGFFEVVAVPEWLELEIGAHYLRTMTEVDEVPVDLVLKKPFHPLPWLNPYVGLGPTVVAELAGEESEVLAGLVAVAGSYFWLTGAIGVSAELDYNVVRGSELVQEVAGLWGLVMGL